MRTPIVVQPGAAAGKKPRGIPLKFFLSEDMMPDRETLEQLEQLAATPDLKHHVAVLPDVHRKRRNVSATGTAVISSGSLIPRAVDTGINCGMRMVRTDIDVQEFTVGVLDRLFGELMTKIPVHMHEEETLAEEELHEIFLRGGEWSQDRHGLSDEEMDCIEDRGTAPTDTSSPDQILAAVPKQSIKKGKRLLGTIGDGNHFLELQEIVEVLDENVAKALGLQKGNAFFMLHTGSRGVGSKLMKSYLKHFEQKLPRDHPLAPTRPIWSIPADSDEGRNYARGVSAVSNFGFANRIAITEILRQSVRSVFADPTVRLPLLYDCSHVSIKAEQLNGEQCWVHRHGASRALPPSRLADHPVFSKTGQPLPIPGSMGHDSFVGVATETVSESFYSVNHGAGRVMDKPEALATFTEDMIEQELKEKNIRLYRYRSDNIAEQAPRSFKDISSVVQAMESLALATPVIRLRPVAVLKG